MTWRDLHREEAIGVGETEQSFQELVGIGDPCDRCGSREADRWFDGHNVCGRCEKELSDGQDEPEKEGN